MSSGIGDNGKGRLEISAALANSGDMQLELIQQRCETPSLFREFMDTSGEGMQHFAVWADEYDALYKHALGSNFTIGPRSAAVSWTPRISAEGRGPAVDRDRDRELGGAGVLGMAIS